MINEIYRIKVYGRLFLLIILSSFLINCGSGNDDPQSINTDTDNDGIPDLEDECATIPGIAAFNGCPDPDRDNDGIANIIDDCPDAAGTADTNGCPDTDNDGISDNNDECPEESGIAELNGCPKPDSDNDGIPDDTDNCPEIAGTLPLNGCPVDNSSNIPLENIGNGVNLQPSYYNSGNVVVGWDLMANYPEITTIRIEIEPFVNIETAKQWLQGAQDIGLTVIATYHDAIDAGLGNNDKQNLINAANWWVENYSALKETGPFIVNLSNEWGNHDLTASQYADAYNDAIEIVRGVYGGLIIIDVPGWGQNVKVAAEASPLIEDENIILSAHIYEGAYYQPEGRALQATDLDQLANTGRPCILGEFGHDASADIDETGFADWKAIVEHARDNLNWPVLGWCWNGDGGTTMNMVSPSWAQNATATTFTPDPEHMNRIIDIISKN
ncbi:cellulase family glycosylhydrolase [Abyssalbus ytuae]|uniref:Cellulase family glycosylhydrolase n=1 Tax=Abyssalbus ytuae TaxID=2926907 RepID=A0A9E6ZL75_9FLAO|nr:cellulase family glycosylhydrolase [Abyssalbus ytuae]UOB17822.1 cellulase family glycosylhydrolase [Abyssalbus ytuae]